MGLLSKLFGQRRKPVPDKARLRRAKAELEECIHIFTNSKTLITIFGLMSMISCSSVPVQTYITKQRISKFSLVALNVLSSDIDVRYSRDESPSAAAPIMSLLGSLPGLLITAGIESSVALSKDHDRAELVKKSIEGYSIKKSFGNFFITNFSKANIFKIEYLENTIDYKYLVSRNYDAVIELYIKEFTLRRGVEGLLELYVSIDGKMIDLRENTIVWQRIEAITSDEKSTLDDYKSNEGKFLIDVTNNVLKKIAFRLSSDIIYSK